ncbi:MAG: efflux RND transporter periplasmic adaptor subunit [Mariprofundaceae bacterium]|nr:efflux RND transporter periplasmic adaptor subunit [Mariprofundaceae bacterium]
MKYSCVLAAFLWIQGMGAAVGAEEASVRPVIVHQVTTGVVARRDVNEWLHVYGRVSFDEAWMKNISLAYGGQIIRLPVLAGEFVRKGRTLVEIVVDPAAASTYRKAVSAVGFARTELVRIRRLLADQLATQSRLAAAEKGLADSRAQLRQLREKGLGKSLHVIRSPFDAVVASVAAQAGERTAPATTLMQLGRPRHLKVILGVEPEDIRWVAAGHPVRISPAWGPGLRIMASVDKILHAVNPQTRLVNILVRLSGAQTKPFLPGMTVSADVGGRLFPRALTVPRQAVMYGGNRSAYVMRVEKGRAVRVPVRVLLEQGGYVVVDGSLQQGEPVVTAGVAELSDGDSVKVNNTKANAGR